MTDENDIRTKHCYICEGCDRVEANDKTCQVYAFVPPYYIRHGCCPYNKKATTVPKKKVRVGQQKTKRLGK